MATKKSAPGFLQLGDLYVIGDLEGDPADHPLHRRVRSPATPELIESIDRDGMRTPIHVAPLLVLRDETGVKWPVMEQPGWEDRFLVVNGIRRTDALREVNQRLAARGQAERPVKITLVEGGMLECLATGIITNDHGVTDLPSVKAAKMVSLHQRKIALPDIGRWYGIGEKQVRNYLKFNKCIPEVKAAVDREDITMNQALEWAELPPGEQLDKLNAEINPQDGGGGDGGGGGGGGSDPDKIRKPSRKTIRDVANYEGSEHLLGRGFIDACLWVNGEKRETEIDGLEEVLAKLKGQKD